MVTFFFSSLLIFSFALTLAGLEIEAEGKFGWAEGMPTWYRTQGMAAGIYGQFMGKKPLTGYHSFMFFLPLIVFHLPFAMGLPLSARAEFKTLSTYFLVAVTWDFLWFVLNPSYGIKKFKKDLIWWHRQSYWVLGLFPIDYLIGWATGAGISLASSWWIDSRAPWSEYLNLSATFAILTFIAILLSPLYHEWKIKMHQRDDRKLAPIIHPPEIFGDNAA